MKRLPLLPRLWDIVRAFTLVEMLVVIAVIAILAGLLLPVLSTARERSRQTACGGHLGQIGKGINIYLHDHTAQLPYHQRFTENGEWVQAPNTSLSLIYPNFVDTVEVFKCPSSKEKPAITLSYTNPTSNVRYRHSYFGWAAKSAASKDDKDLTNSSYGYDHRTSYYEMSSSAAIAADINDHFSRNDGAIADETANHLYGANVLYLDWHVKFGKITRINHVAQGVWLSDNEDDDVYQRQTGWSADTDAYILLTYGTSHYGADDN